MLARRDDLRGRFNALVVKRQSLRIDDHTVLNLESELKNLLFKNITPISRVEPMFRDYTAYLAGRTAP